MALMRIAKIEVSLRVSAILLLVLTACLVRFDAQTKQVFLIEKNVTYKDLKSLSALVYVESVAAGYNLLQLSRFSFSDWRQGNLKGSFLYLGWVCFLLDQIAVYITFTATTAALQQSALVVTGAKVFQWLKWCNKFTRFCFQIGGALATAYVASVLMALISFFSAFNLFRLYSPKQFLRLKSRNY